jgi:transcriptional regulator with XRE-family HTH domain
MDEARSIEEIVGEKVRAHRQERGFTQDELARRCGTVGFLASRSVIDAIERGTRQLRITELLGLLAVLGMSLEDLCGAGPVALDGGLSVNADTLVEQARGEQHSWDISRGSESFVVIPSTGAVISFSSTAALRGLVRAYTDAEMKAARKLRVDPQAISETAERLWGHSLAGERDQRVRAQAAEGASARSIQALRGHVTRALLEEIGDNLESEKETK